MQNTEDMIVYTTKDIAKILKVSVPTARKIMTEPGFPLYKNGKIMRVSKAAFEEWASKNSL